MGIENLLAQGVQIRPQGMEANALMQYQQFQQQQAQNALMNYQLSQAKRKDAADEQAALQLAQWRNALQMPQGQQELVPGRPAMNAAQAESAAMTPGYGVSSAQDQWKTGAPDPRMVALTGAAKAGLMGPADFLKAAYPEQKIGHAPAGSMIFDERTGRQIAQVPDKPKTPTDVEAYQYSVSQGDKRTYAQWKHDNAAAGATTISMLSPVPVKLADGTTALVQPPNRPGAAPTVVKVDGQNVAPLKDGEKPVPDSVIKAVGENRNSLAKIDTAIKLLDSPGAGSAMGAINALPGAEMVRQYTDPEGAQLRAIVSDIGSLKLHDRSGAAVSASEFPRLAPFIPSARDTPDVAKRKLQQLRVEYQNTVDDMKDAYSQANGFKPSTIFTSPIRANAPKSSLPVSGAQSSDADPLGIRRGR